MVWGRVLGVRPAAAMLPESLRLERPPPWGTCSQSPVRPSPPPGGLRPPLRCPLTEGGCCPARDCSARCWIMSASRSASTGRPLTQSTCAYSQSHSAQPAAELGSASAPSCTYSCRRHTAKVHMVLSRSWLLAHCTNSIAASRRTDSSGEKYGRTYRWGLAARAVRAWPMSTLADAGNCTLRALPMRLVPGTCPRARPTRSWFLMASASSWVPAGAVLDTLTTSAPLFLTRASCASKALMSQACFRCIWVMSCWCCACMVLMVAWLLACCSRWACSTLSTRVARAPMSCRTDKMSDRSGRSTSCCIRVRMESRDSWGCCVSAEPPG